MPDLTRLALERARQSGADYADIRVVEDKSESIHVKNGIVSALRSSESKGFGIRVLYQGAWGFASSSRFEEDEVKSVAEMAVKIAKASGLARKDRPFELSPLPAVKDSWKSKVAKDPFEVKLEDKIATLLESDRLLRTDPKVRVADSEMGFWREKTTFASTEGSFIEQEITESGGGLSATAVDQGELQRRSYPASFGGDVSQAGYEWIEGLDLARHAEQTARDAVALLTAKQCPSGTTTLILESSQLGLQIHESCGHPIELDRVFGTEASYAGTSFLTTEKLGNFRYGSDKVNIVADATLPGGLGSFRYDDEGVPGQRTVIMDHGLFQNYLTSRETAAELGQKSNGTMRADGWNRLPIIRMTNINLEPGDWTLDEMIKDTKDGIYMATNRSWSIDDKRLNFQFGTEVAWEIKDGALGAMLKNPTYTGITPQFWGSLDAVAGKKEWHLWGLPNCGKGEPPQGAHVGHGAAPSRFRNVRVGVGKW
ncbi:MAG: TldD/PmbA family protein [Bacillota bacterium]